MTKKQAKQQATATKQSSENRVHAKVNPAIAATVRNETRDNELKAASERVVTYLQEAHAMEQTVLRMLDSMISATAHGETLVRLREHRQETERHGYWLEDRLKQLGKNCSLLADITGMAGAMLNGVGDMVRSDKPARNARDGYVTEQMEIALYRLLERFAEAAQDDETARVVRTICREEERMAEWFDSQWDLVVEQSLAETESNGSAASDAPGTAD